MKSKIMEKKGNQKKNQIYMQIIIYYIINQFHYKKGIVFIIMYISTTMEKIHIYTKTKMAEEKRGSHLEKGEHVKNIAKCFIGVVCIVRNIFFWLWWVNHRYIRYSVYNWWKHLVIE